MRVIEFIARYRILRLLDVFIPDLSPQFGDAGTDTLHYHHYTHGKKIESPAWISLEFLNSTMNECCWVSGGKSH